jgi:hypothetical protein
MGELIEIYPHFVLPLKRGGISRGEFNNKNYCCARSFLNSSVSAGTI